MAHPFIQQLLNGQTVEYKPFIVGTTLCGRPKKQPVGWVFDPPQRQNANITAEYIFQAA